MTEAEKVEALRTIIAETERLRTLAQWAGADMLAFLLENSLHEARATLIGAGHEPRARELSDEGRSSPVVVPLVPPNRPRRRR